MVMGKGVLAAVTSGHEEEELQLRPGVVVEAHLLRLTEDAHQDFAWIAGKGIPVWRKDPANNARGGIVTSLPWDDAKRPDIGQEIHVRFGDPSKTFDRRSIKPGSMLD